jgi:hypothetical protein
MHTHIKVLGGLYLGVSIVSLLIGGFIFLLLIGIGAVTNDQTAFWTLTIVGIVVGSFLVLISIPGIVAGIGLLRFRSWARILALVLGVLNLFNIPFGTLLGLYTFLILLSDESTPLFEQAPVASEVLPPVPPTPPVEPQSPPQ